MTRISSLVAVVTTLLALACSRREKEPASLRAEASSAPLVLPPLPSSDPRANPACEAPRACLRRALSSDFDVSRSAALEQSALGCLGGTLASAWGLRECLPFTFARDRRTNQLIQLSISCGDICPQYANLVFDFAEEMSRFECTCRGFFPLQAPGTAAYTGCAPPPPNASARFFDVVEPGNGQRIVVQGDPRFEELGFWQGSAVESVDGTPITTTDELSRRLSAIPERLPGEIRLRRGSPPSTKELHYVPRDAAENLARLAGELDLASLAAAHTDCINPDTNSTPKSALVRVTFGGGKLPSGAPLALFRKLQCSDDASRRVIQFEDAVARAAAEARPREVPSTGAPSACKDAEKVRLFAVARESESVELRYVDWARR